jgi:hypothetical protein
MPDSASVHVERPRYMRLRGDGENVTRYRVNRKDTAVHLYVDVRGQYTLADLVDFVAEHGALPTDVIFTGGCFVITQPATPEDVARWEQYDAEKEAHDKESRRALYERLKAEFEGESDD